jgi:hypothetical protein
MKVIAIVVVLCLVACMAISLARGPVHKPSTGSPVPGNWTIMTPASEQGYRHLMDALKSRSMNACENLEHTGDTCLTAKGHVVCAPTRDGAAEAAAEWIEANIPVPLSSVCGTCGGK